MAIKKIRVGDKEFSLDEWLHWPLYSTVEAAAGVAVNLRAFSYVVGANVPRVGLPARAATTSDTNQVARSRINHDEAFICYSMTYETTAIESAGPPPTFSDAVFPVPPLDMAADAPVFYGPNLRSLQLDLMLELFVGANISKPMASAPLEYYGQGIGAVAFGSGDALTIAFGASTALNLDYGTGGYISPRNQRRWRLPVYIDSDRAMHARVRSPGGALLRVNQNWSMKVYMDGMKRRAVA
jgi:hypothetical protein